MNTQVVVAKPDRTALKQAKIAKQTVAISEVTALLKELVRSPVVQLIGGYYLVDNILLPSTRQNGDPLYSAEQERFVKTAIAWVIAAQALAPLAPSVAYLGGQAMTAVGSVTGKVIDKLPGVGDFLKIL